MRCEAFQKSGRQYLAPQCADGVVYMPKRGGERGDEREERGERVRGERGNERERGP